MMKWTRVRTVAVAALLAIVGLSSAVAQAVNAENPVQHSGSAATKPVVEESPKQVVAAAYRSALAGDENGMIGRFADLTDEQTATLRQATHVFSAVNDLKNAISAKFGPAVLAQLPSRVLGVGLADVEGAAETITGDTATVDMGEAGPRVVPMVKVRQSWKISSDVLKNLNAGAVAAMDAKVPAIRKVAADVTAGAFKSPQDLQQALVALMR